MALIKCPECGKMFSEHAECCPECGCPVSKQKSILICPECGNKISEDCSSCPNCGCPSSEFQAAHVINCPECGALVENNEEKCSNCGFPLKMQIGNKGDSNRQPKSVQNTSQEYAVELYNRGLNYQKKGLYNEAFDCFVESAKLKNLDSISQVGFCYMVGQGVSLNYLESIKYLEEAAKNGNKYALYNLGVCYINGFGVEVDNERGVSFIRQAASQGHSKAISYLNNNPISSSPDKTTDVYAIIAFASALVSLLVLPILFVPISIISNCVSYYKLKENPNLKGWGLKIAAAIICFISIAWYFYILRNS